MRLPQWWREQRKQLISIVVAVCAIYGLIIVGTYAKTRNVKTVMKLVFGATGMSKKFVHYLRPNKAHLQQRITNARAIGEHVGHSTNVAFMTEDFGKFLQYEGQLSGGYYPEKGIDGAADGEPPTVDAIAAYVTEKFPDGPDYFVVTAVNAYNQQETLRTYLARFPILVQEEGYMIFDTRATSAPISPQDPS